MKHFKSSREHASDVDKKCFKALDVESKKLRDSARAMATTVSTIQNLTPELATLVQSLNKISDTKIETMDEAINKLHFDFASLNLKVLSDKQYARSFQPEETLKLLESFGVVMKEADKLVKKAMALNASASHPKM